MKSFLPVLKWLGYSRRERRASVILLFLIIVVVLIKFLVPEAGIEIKELSFRPGPPASDQKIIKNKPAIYYQQKRIELNSSDSVKLVTLPGIGAVLAGRIIRFRRILGGFVSTTQLREVYGLKEETYILISNRIEVDTSLVIYIRINQAGYSELVRHPYLEPADVKAIMKYRELKGTIGSFRLVEQNNLIDSIRINKIRPYLRYD